MYVHPADALQTLHFSWVIYPDIRVVLFQVFCTSPGHVLHFCICIAYFSRTFTHQIIHVHPRDSPEIPHFSRVIYLDTRVVSLRFSAHPWDMYCFFTCVWHICSGHLPTNLFVYIPQMLQKLQIFPKHLPGHKFCIFPGHLPETHESFSGYSASAGS